MRPVFQNEPYMCLGFVDTRKNCVFYDSVEFLLRRPVRDLSLVYDIDTNID